MEAPAARLARAATSLGHKALRAADIALHQALHLREAPPRLHREAAAFWSRDDGEVQQHAHLRGAGIFAEDDRWLALGREHVELYDRLAPLAGLGPHAARIVEWGCGGGANAVHFAARCEVYAGVEVSAATLARCEEELARSGFEGFQGAVVEPHEPEQALAQLERGTFDLFLCTYVFELLPSAQIGLRILGVARELLRPGGAALVQIKYDRGTLRTRPRQWAYARNMASMTSWRTEDFWEAASGAGLSPLAVVLRPQQPLVHDGRYAYFLLRRD